MPTSPLIPTDVRFGPTDLYRRNWGSYQLVSMVEISLIVEGIRSHVEAVADDARESTVIQYNLPEP